MRAGYRCTRKQGVALPANGSLHAAAGALAQTARTVDKTARGSVQRQHAGIAVDSASTGGWRFSRPVFFRSARHPACGRLDIKGQGM